jgi:hypothetical protein
MRRILLAAALTASLAATSPSVFDSLWSLLSRLWSAPEAVDIGCGWDPNGRCQPQPQSDIGCGFDPSGRCQPGS